jgi:hypothetical protein
MHDLSGSCQARSVYCKWCNITDIRKTACVILPQVCGMGCSPFRILYSYVAYGLSVHVNRSCIFFKNYNIEASCF